MGNPERMHGFRQAHLCPLLASQPSLHLQPGGGSCQPFEAPGRVLASELLREGRGSGAAFPAVVNPRSLMSCRLMSLGFIPPDLLTPKNGVPLRILFCGLLLSLDNISFYSSIQGFTECFSVDI